MAHRIAKGIVGIGGAAMLFAAGVALGSVTPADHHAVQKINQFGERFGWVAHLVPPDPNLPPDPYVPPDPYAPPDPYKPTVALAMNTSARPDLNQQMTLLHTDEGGGISPCVRVRHQFLGDGSMSETIDILGTEDAVEITVPEGFQLIETATGYALAPITGDVLPPQ